MANEIFLGASKSLAKDMFLEDGTLYVHKTWQGEPELLSFVGLAKKRGIVNFQFMETADFEKRSATIKVNSGGYERSELQDYAVKLIETAYKSKASDIHIADYGNYGIIQFRCLGMLRIHGHLPGEKAKQLIGVIYGTLSQQGSTSSHTPTVRQDARIAKREYLPNAVHSIRVHTEPLECAQADGGVGCLMCLRLLYDRTSAKGDLMSRLKVLGYAGRSVSDFQFLSERTGLNIISGPTGHGKSTLLKHTMEAQAEESPEKSFQSIEDPPEYPLVGVKQIMVHTGGDSGADHDARSRHYIEAIAGAMRSDPDVLMIGEIRYPDAAVAAIDAALTGHSVWATLHANNALGIIMRMVSLLNSANYAEPLEYLCDHSVVAGLIYQRLVPVLCPKCKVRLTDANLEYRKDVLPNYVMDRVLKVIDNHDEIHIRGKGCPHCDNFGFIDQTVAAEIIVTDNTLLKHIRHGSMADAYDYWRKTLGGKTYIQDAIEKMEKGILDPYMTEERLGVPLTYDSYEGAGGI